MRHIRKLNGMHLSRWRRRRRRRRRRHRLNLFSPQIVFFDKIAFPTKKTAKILLLSQKSDEFGKVGSQLNFRNLQLELLRK